MKETRCVYNQNIYNTNNNNIRIYELYMYIIHICLFYKVIRTIIKIKKELTLGTNFPRITRRLLPSIEPSVPSSAIMNWNTWSELRPIVVQISWKFTHRVFFVPTKIRKKKRFHCLAYI